MLVFNTNQCRDVKDWFQFYAREWNVPCLGVHTPRAIGEVDRPMVDYMAGQIEALVEPLEKVAGQKLDADRLREVVIVSKQTTTYWKAVLDAAANVPSPITFFDGTIQMGPAVVMRGLKEAGQYYEVLLAELNERVAAGVAAVAGERLRIYWEGMPIWGKLSALGRPIPRTASLRRRPRPIAIVGSSRPSIRPILSAAWPKPTAASSSAAPTTRRKPTSNGWCGSFKIDGMLYHDAKTCPNNSNSRYGLPQRIAREAGQALPDHQRRLERHAAVFGRADADQHRGLRRATAAKVSFVGYFCGIDIGASAAKLVIVDERQQVVAETLRRSGVDYAETARRCLEQALETSGLCARGKSPAAISTGYGRDNVPFAGGKMTEIACHGKGAFHAFRRAMTVIDIGAQDSKVIHLDDQGCRTSFKMNRKCAAGTGAFLEEIAYRLDLSPGRAQRPGRAFDQRGFAGQLLHGVRRHRDSGEDSRRRKDRRHHQRGVSLGGQAGAGNGHDRRRAGDHWRRGGP